MRGDGVVSAEQSVRGIVLAAGRSERMGGRPKALLTLKGPAGRSETFVARALRVLGEGGIASVIVVVNPDTVDAVRDACPPGTLLAVNPHPEDGMVSSIRAALATEPWAAEPADKVLITLVDIPEISADVVRALLGHRAPHGAWMTLPLFSDGRGHPLLLYRAVFPSLVPDLPRGLKTLMEREPDRICDLPISGPQPWDVDTPDDYRRYNP